MRRLQKLRLRLRSLFARGRVEEDLDEELQFHLERQIERNLQAGMTPEKARQAALRLFGGVEQMKEHCRDARGVAWVETVLQDLRYAVRSMRKSPGFTVVALLTLALGIGATTTIFSAINAVMLRPLPYPEPDRLVVLWGTNRQQLDSLFKPVADSLPWNKRMVLSQVAERWRASSRSFSHIGWYGFRALNWTGNGEAERILATLVSADFFPCLGVAPALGRGFLGSEMTPGNDRVIILSDGLWRRRFAGDPRIIGKTVILDGEPNTVIGVLPDGFRAIVPWAGSDGGLWAPISRGYQPGVTWTVTSVVGRLKPGSFQRICAVEALIRR